MNTCVCFRHGSVQVLTDTASVSNTCRYWRLTRTLTDIYCSLAQTLTDMCFRRGSVRVLTDMASVSNTCSYYGLTQTLLTDMCFRRGSVRVLTDTASVSNTCCNCSLTQTLTDMCFRRGSVRVLTVMVMDHTLVRSHLGVLRTGVPARPCRVWTPCKTTTGCARRSTNPGL